MSLFAGEQGNTSLKKTRLLALTEWGNVSLWSVHVLDSGSAGEADVGMQIGGRVCLLRLADSLPMGRTLPDGLQALSAEGHSMLAKPHQQSPELGRHAAVLALPPSSIDQFLVGTNNARILRGSLFGEAPVPKVICSNLFYVLS